MADESTPAVDNKSDCDNQAVTADDGSMPLTPKNVKYEPLRSLSDLKTTRDLTEDGVRDLLRRYTRDHGLEIVKMGALEDMSGLNDAFNSSICSMHVTIKRSEAETEEEFNFVIKSPPSSSFIRMMHKFTGPFFNEVTWYEDLVPLLEMVNGKGCIERMLPKCYFAYSNYYMQEEHGSQNCCEKRKCPWFCYVPCKPAEVGILILENIKFREKATYKMYNKIKPIDLNHVNLVMKELANFHGMWLRYKFAAKKGNLESLATRRSSDGSPEVHPVSWETFERRHNTQKRMPKLIYSQLKKVAKRTVLRILSQCGEEEVENAQKCRRFFDHTATQWLNEYMREEAKPVHTLCHGDFWSNNILFTYGEDPDNPSSLVIIDYQLIFVGSPCYDLVYFVYLNTDKAFRDQHLQTCLKLYYDQFATYFDDHLTYSYEEFLEEFHRFKNIGFTTACSVMPNILSDKAIDIEGNPITAFRDLQRKQEEDMDDVNSECGQEIKRRIIDLVHEMANDGVI